MFLKVLNNEKNGSWKIKSEIFHRA